MGVANAKVWVLPLIEVAVMSVWLIIIIHNMWQLFQAVLNIGSARIIFNSTPAQIAGRIGVERMES